MGEEKICTNSTRGDLRVDTPGDVFQVRWDENARASALGQLVVVNKFTPKVSTPRLFISSIS